MSTTLDATTAHAIECELLDIASMCAVIGDRNEDTPPTPVDGRTDVAICAALAARKARAVLAMLDPGAYGDSVDMNHHHTWRRAQAKAIVATLEVARHKDSIVTGDDEHRADLERQAEAARQYAEYTAARLADFQGGEPKADT